MPQPLNAIAAGHLCLDIIPDFDQLDEMHFETLFKPGHLIQIGSSQFSSGGSVSNTGLALHHLGIPTRLVAKIGADPYGNILRDLIASKDPTLVEGFQVDPHADTSYSIIISNPSIDRMFLHCPGANDTFTENDIDYSLVRQSALFHFGYPPIMRQMYTDGGRHLFETMRRAKETGATTSMDMSLPDPSTESGRVDWKEIYRNILPFVDIFLPSLEELLFTFKRPLYDQMVRKGDILDQATPVLLKELSTELMALGVKIVVIKLGTRGLYLRTTGLDRLEKMGRATPENCGVWATCEKWVPCFKVSLVGTTGSGDCTIAGFLAALLRGEPPEQALRMAVAVGACNVEAADSLSGLRTWEETHNRIDNGWDQIPSPKPESGWEWDASNKLWISPLDGHNG